MRVGKYNKGRESGETLRRKRRKKCAGGGGGLKAVACEHEVVRMGNLKKLNPRTKRKGTGIFKRWVSSVTPPIREKGGGQHKFLGQTRVNNRTFFQKKNLGLGQKMYRGEDQIRERQQKKGGIRRKR